ncbi:MAG: hypothetical protein U1F81_12650 [Verrucomicrobiaceae bacterium]
MKHLLLPAFAVLLSSCIDPYMMNMGPAPYGDPYRSQYRQDMRDQGRQMNQMAYERGWQDGQADAQRRQSQNYNRYRTSRFDRSTEMAYRDGYNQSYAQSSSSLNNLNQPPPYYPPQGGGYQQPQPAPAENDAAYQQGYDYGLRDRVGGRVADPAAHVGRYDPRKRSSFERGYYDGYNSRSSMNSPAPATGSRLWNL